MTVVSLWLTATGLPALTAGPATWMRAVASAAGVLRAVMPTSSTATEAATEIATIFKWVARSASTIVELLITAIFRGLFQTWGATYVVSWADIWVQMHPNARSLFLDCGVNVLQPGMTASRLPAKHPSMARGRRSVPSRIWPIIKIAFARTVHDIVSAIGTKLISHAIRGASCHRHLN
jgi:hypothetical protein